MEGTALLAWWDRNRADLPWRQNPTPYAVWVSEIMLQQTVVKAAVTHYRRWMDRWPSVEALADASERSVTRMWEGLGYYSRARNLLAAARMVRREHGGRLPDTYAGLTALPGVGDYTARAILSIAYRQPVTLVDANVRRILQRLRAWRAWDAKARREGHRLLEDLMVAARPGDFNQALMELGQRICRQKDPICARCPLAAACEARAGGLQAEIPALRPRVAVRRESRVPLLLCGDHIWLCPPGGSLFRGLWTLPRVPRGTAPRGRPVALLRARTHAYTRYRERLHPEIHRLDSRSAATALGLDHGRWVPFGLLEGLPLPSMHRTIVRDLERYLQESG